MARDISILKQMPKQMPRTDWAIANHKWREILQAYLACISFTDHQVGRVIEAMDKSPYRDNTVIVLCSDHGYHMGEKNTFQKQSLWERASHSPLVIAGAQVKSGRRCDRVVSLLDIYPTLVDMCGLPANVKNEGRSLVALLENPDKDWPYPAIIGWRKKSFALQTERYRYIRYGDGSEELYDHHIDLKEWTNLVGKPGMDGVRKDLAEALDRGLQNPRRHPGSSP
jgi:arylsulfatase A-like enzyme